MHFRHLNLVVDRVVVDSEAVVQDIRNQRANGLMPWPVGEGRDDLGKVILSPGAAHGRRMARRGCSYQGLYLNALPAYNIWYVRPSRLATIRPVRCAGRSEDHTSELQSRSDLVCRLLLEKKNNRELSERVGQKKENEDVGDCHKGRE